MVDKELNKVMERIDNSTEADAEAVTKKLKEQKEAIRIRDLSNECLGFIATRQEEYATERITDELNNKYVIYTTRDDIKSEIWVYDNGIYKPNGESFIKELVRRLLMHAYTPQRANKVIAKVEADTFIDTDEFFGKSYLNEICVQNGILNLETRELSPFTPKKIFFNKLPVAYNRDAVCKNVDKFFGSVLKDESDKMVLYELVGFCLHKDYFIEKAFMFIGDGRNGKSKTLQLIKNFLGSENTCAVRLSQMEDKNSALCELHNRLVNLAGDLNKTALKDTGIFKGLTARDSVQVKRKYLRDLIFTNYAKMIFACNDLPRVYDFSDGFWSRWVVMEFPYKFLPQKEIEKRSPEERKMCRLQDPGIIKKLITPVELSGLLNEAIEGLDRLKIKKEFSYSKGTAAVKDFWIRQSDSFTAFCMDEIIEDCDNWISKKNLRQAFNRYCKSHKVKGCGDKNIKSVLEDMYGVIESQRDESNRERVWEGIRFRADDSKTAQKELKSAPNT